MIGVPLGEAGDRHVQPDFRGVRRAVGAEIGAKEVHRVGDFERRSRPRALFEHRGDEARDAEFAGRSSALPRRTTRSTWTTGTSCSSTSQTGTPFESWRF
jgi:hypothetical protein